MILSLVIKYSIRDLICDVNYYYAWSVNLQYASYNAKDVNAPWSFHLISCDFH